MNRPSTRQRGRDRIVPDRVHHHVEPLCCLLDATDGRLAHVLFRLVDEVARLEPVAQLVERPAHLLAGLLDVGPDLGRLGPLLLGHGPRSVLPASSSGGAPRGRRRVPGSLHLLLDELDVLADRLGRLRRARGRSPGSASRRARSRRRRWRGRRPPTMSAASQPSMPASMRPRTNAGEQDQEPGVQDRRPAGSDGAAAHAADARRDLDAREVDLAPDEWC